MIKLGSLFDGSGTAPLCAAILGWEPVWASEIESFPVAVTSKRFPNMKHLGDIRNINGGEIEPVDVIVGGSPCQSLSIAGTRKGLQEGAASHIFYEMIRVI
jgi:DNA (cytosine-5)-methyltransferase 1